MISRSVVFLRLFDVLSILCILFCLLLFHFLSLLGLLCHFLLHLLFSDTVLLIKVLFASKNFVACHLKHLEKWIHKPVEIRKCRQIFGFFLSFTDDTLFLSFFLFFLFFVLIRLVFIKTAFIEDIFTKFFVFLRSLLKLLLHCSQCLFEFVNICCFICFIERVNGISEIRHISFKLRYHI